jgi:hypothetical protein
MLDAKLKIIRNKILMLLQNFGREEEKAGNLETLPNDELLKRLTELIQFLKEREQFMSGFAHSRIKSVGSTIC